MLFLFLRPVTTKLLLLLAGLILALVPARGENPGSISVSVLTFNNPFFKEIADNIRSAAKTRNYNVIAGSADFDVAKHQNQINLSSKKSARSCFVPPIPKRSARRFARPTRPAFSFSPPTPRRSIRRRESFRTSPRTISKAAKWAADAMIEALGGKGAVAILDHPEVESVLLRTKGFEERLAELNKQPGNE